MADESNNAPAPAGEDHQHDGESREEAFKHGCLINFDERPYKQLEVNDEDGSIFEVVRKGKEIREIFGIEQPIALSAALVRKITPASQDSDRGTTLDERLWDMLLAYRTKVGAKVNDPDIETRFQFRISWMRKKLRIVTPVDVSAIFGPGDLWEETLTFMLPEECC